MPEKHGNAKETDITSALVIVFTILVAVMIVKVAGDFSKQSTSTSTRAVLPCKSPQYSCQGGTACCGAVKKPASATTADESCKDELPLNTTKISGAYNYSNDKCSAQSSAPNIRITCPSGTLNDYMSYSTQTLWCTGALHCCRGGSVVALGAPKCVSRTGDLAATCVKTGSSCPNDRPSKSANACAYTSGSDLYDGDCCAVASPTSTPTPTPLPLDNTRCGTSQMDCTATFNSVGGTVNDNVNMKDKAGNVLSSACFMPLGSTNRGDASCRIILANSNDKNNCDGLQYASPVYYSGRIENRHCAVSKKGTSLLTDGNLYNVCNTAVYDMGASSDTCKVKADRVR